VRRAFELHQQSIESESAIVPNPVAGSDDPLSTPPSSPPEDDEGETTPKASKEIKAQGAPVVELPIQPPIDTKASHVLIVDDNDINLKVCLHDPSPQKPILCSY
jgi:hypothetical protein